jgi:CRISPR system Cascade subunit CasC
MKANTHNLKVELHILQNFPPANLNRDDNNMPKDAYYGGWRRSRVSSQSWKRAIRTSEEFKKRVDNKISFRTKYLSQQVAEFLQKNHKRDKPNSDEIAKLFADNFLSEKKKKDEQDSSNKSTLLLYIAEQHIQEMTDMLNGRWDEIMQEFDKKAAEGSTVPNEISPPTKLTKEEQKEKEAKEKEENEAKAKTEFELLRGQVEEIIAKYQTDTDSKDTLVALKKIGAIKDKETKPVIEDFKKALDSLVGSVKKIEGMSEATKKDEVQDNDGQPEKETSGIIEELKDAIAKYGTPDEAITAIMKALKKEIAKKYKSNAGTVDIGLFGRMLTSLPEIDIDAACQVAHVISTNKLKSEFDFFTAVDDLNTSDASAGMMGLAGYNANCYYRYMVLDVRQLAENLGYAKKELNDDERKTIKKLVLAGIEAFLHAAVEAIPSAKQNTFAAHPRPAFVLAVVRENSAPLSLVNAFEKPIQPDEEHSLTDNSIIALDKHWRALSKMYGTVACKNIFVAALGGKEYIKSLTKPPTKEEDKLSLAQYVQEGTEGKTDIESVIEQTISRLGSCWQNNNSKSEEKA